MKDTFNNHLDYLIANIENIKNNKDAIKQAASLIVTSLKNKNNFFILGTGHSFMIGEEFYGRANGLAIATPILEPELSLMQEPRKSTMIERIPEYFNVIDEIYHFKGGDVIMIVSNSGRNSLPIEAAMKLKARGLKIIALTNLEFSKNIDSRHQSQKKLYELSDVVIDNFSGKTDGDFFVDDTRIGALSSVMGISIVQLLSSQIVLMMKNEKMAIPIFKSSNLNNNDASNEQIMRKRYARFFKS